MLPTRPVPIFAREVRRPVRIGLDAGSPFVAYDAYGRSGGAVRFVYFAIFALAAIGAFIWLRQSPVGTPGGLQRPAMATATAPIPTTAGPRKNGAANAIRSTSVTPAALARTATDASARGASPEGDPAATRSAIQSASPVPVPDVKPAADLFSGFVDDDPSVVFLPSSVQYHAALESETVDPSWGPAAADALRNAITAHYGDRFELPLVDCRQDLCELRVAGRVGGDQLADMQDFQQLVSMMKAEPWWLALGFDQQTGMIGTAPDGRALLLYFFSRK